MKIIKILFVITDFVAWLLCGLCLVSAVCIPVAVPAYAQAIRHSVSWFEISFSSMYLLLLAIGFYGIAKHKLLAFGLILSPIVMWLYQHHPKPAVVYLLVVGGFFALPHGLVYGTSGAHAQREPLSD